MSSRPLVTVPPLPFRLLLREGTLLQVAETLGAGVAVVLSGPQEWIVAEGFSGHRDRAAERPIDLVGVTPVMVIGLPRSDNDAWRPVASAHRVILSLGPVP
ncbi:hypothetical protein SAMN05192575_1188 [Nocardioides alpinus]|uniref:Uncharacterized protein n=1 Tax=Nocardioides alpinus TaxID=748909 RepID=A0A1I1BED8_9ACTN|nr:hypothetical protein SAMN05192575_1188 [Nocardioides alpinus]